MRSAVKTYSALAAILVLLPLASQTQLSTDPPPVPTIVLRVLHIYDSPGMWSGVAEFDQPIDVEALQTNSGGFKTGQSFTLGIPIVFPSVLFDHKTVELSPKYIPVGRSFRVHDRGGCFFPPHSLPLYDNCVQNRIETGRFTLDPSCIEPVSPTSNQARKRILSE